ncbi:DUF2379 family protein [Corallococcus sp. AB018]|uniref:DUF2379 family protein n=1 Tax=Corallococcus sp. AB018 TaxID=2316715 RepID=UPI001F32BA4F|nr:DUF2379 family protein [Corallococcus sp. AB018]
MCHEGERAGPFARGVSRASERAPRAHGRAACTRTRGGGDFDGARQERREVLAARVTPHHRAIAQVPLNELADEP